MAKNTFRKAYAAIGLLLVVGAVAYAQDQRNSEMMLRARGTFEVKLNPQKADNNEAETANLGRMSIEKQFHGDLEATSKGEMLSTGTNVKGSAGYVAIERVTGALEGRKGTFVLQHSALMARGATQQMTVTVVPDSGTGELEGLSGAMTIRIENGKHFYELEYSLPAHAR